MLSKIEQCIHEIKLIEKILPAVIIIHNMQNDFTVEYMSDKGLKTLNTTLAELQEMGVEYYNRFFNAEDAEDYIPKITALLEKNSLESFTTFFQQVKVFGKEEWEWYMSATKILLQDEKGLPLLTITLALPIDPEHHVTKKVSRLLEENNFLKSNYRKYATLGDREKEVLKLIALGKGNKEIANELFLSVSTVETHRKNIKRKLEANSNVELNLFARAFDLI